MTTFRDQPLARKALVLGVVPTLSAIAIVGVSSMLATFVTARRNTAIDLGVQASIVAESVSAALAFGDHAAAGAALHPTRARPNIDSVCVFDRNGALFASVASPRHPCDARLSAPTSLDRSPLVLEQPVMVGSRQIGTVRIAGNLSLLYAWMRTQSLVILGALVGSMIVALILTRRIQRAVSSPVLDLAATADAISARRDYALRATQTTGDEVGGLVRSFNAMLDEIQRGDDALNVEIAERKRAEHLKDEFLAAVSHELRTPLNAVLGWLQILRKTPPTPERMARALASLERNALSQARVIEDLLDVSRIVSGKLNVRADVVDLRDVIAGAVDVVSTAAAAKAIHVVAKTPDAPCLVSGDADRLQQVVLNVLANAVKFTPAAGHIGVELGANDASREYAITVSDTGIGIAPEFLPNVFERFRQADGSMTRQHGGLGLGLTIVKEVTELHRGSVAASSAGLGAGATFTVRLPQLVTMNGAAPVDRRASYARAQPAALLRGVQVLVVDDEVDALEIAAAALGDAGAAVTTAASGRAAIDAWEAGQYDVLVSDLAMPDIDGFTVLKRVQDADRRAARRSVAVALTAYVSAEHKQRTLASGFHVHIAKPYDTDDLVRLIAGALDGQSTQTS